MSLNYDIQTDLRYLKGVEIGEEKGIEKGIEKGEEIGIEKGATLKERKVIKNILTEFPNWDDEKIANLANSTIETVQAIRLEMKAEM
jgi:flagellar biosynthesis/type III secretory pathway protein FliH